MPFWSVDFCVMLVKTSKEEKHWQCTILVRSQITEAITLKARKGSVLVMLRNHELNTYCNNSPYWTVEEPSSNLISRRTYSNFINIHNRIMLCLAFSWITFSWKIVHFLYIPDLDSLFDIPCANFPLCSKLFPNKRATQDLTFTNTISFKKAYADIKQFLWSL